MTSSADKMMWEAVVELNVTKLEGSIESGADMNTKTGKQTPLEAVIANCAQESPRMLEIAGLLLGSGAIPDFKKSSCYKQPLYMAAEKGFGETVALLLRYGAQKEKKLGLPVLSLFGQGTTPAQIARKKGFDKIACLIEESE